MNLPQSLKSFLEQLLNSVCEDPNHYLKLEDRYKIYQKFGDHKTEEVLEDSDKTWWMVLSPAARTFSWLAIITARKVIPFWQGEILTEVDYSYSPFEMLEIAEGALLHTINADVLKDGVIGKFHYGMNGIPKNTSSKAENVIFATYSALEAVAFGLDSFQKFSKDFTVFALLAYALDENYREVPNDFITIDPTLLYREVDDPFSSVESIEIEDKRPEGCSAEKSLEFWKWWLAEAIPQAWELAQGDS